MSVTSGGKLEPKQRSLRSVKVREALVGYGFVFVPMFVFALFFLYPIVYALYISFFHWGILGKTSQGSGTFNYSEVLHDPIYHTVFSLSRIKTFDLGRFPKGKSRGERFDKPGVVKVFCQIHSHMSATVMVFDHPWFTVPDEGGTFELPNVPTGTHQITAWHERLGDTTMELRVEPGRTDSVDFVLPVPAQP